MTYAGATRVRWRLVVWIALAGAISYLDRVNLSISGHAVAQVFHLSNVKLGVVFSAFSLGYAALQIPGGYLADRFGPRRVLALGALWWAVFTSLTGAVPGGLIAAALALWIVRFLLGAGEAVMYPSSNRWVANWIPTDERGLANGIIFAGVGAGAALAPPFIAALMVRYGWRESFWACALLGLMVGAGWYLMARDLPAQHPRVGPGELAHIRDGIRAAGAEALQRVPWRSILSSRNVWSITGSYFCYGYVTWIFFAWFFIYLTTVRGLTIQSGSIYAMLPLAAMSAGSALGGFVSDRVCRRFGRWWGRCGVAAAALLAAAVLVAGGIFAPNPKTVALVMAAGAGTIYIAQSAYWSLSADLGGASSGALSGFMNMGAQIGGAVTSVLTPLIAGHFGWPASFLVGAALCGLGGLAWLAVDPDRPVGGE